VVTEHDQRHVLYLQAIAKFGDALARLTRAYESDADQRRDLLQDIHFELWPSFEAFRGRCSLRTWVYRVAHNVGISKRLRKRRVRLVSLAEVADASVGEIDDGGMENAQNVERLSRIIRSLVPPDDQVMLLYLEDLDAASIGEITGLSAQAVTMRVHRVKAILARSFR
jgi:RNA polymerase sigma-70 factor (ECF subfamily)